MLACFEEYMRRYCNLFKTFDGTYFSLTMHYISKNPIELSFQLFYR